MTLSLYRFLTRCFAFLIKLYLYWRRFKGKEDPRRFSERFGLSYIRRPEGILLWLHGASVGECISILPLIDKLLAIYPTASILLTSGTRSSAAIVGSRLPERAIHQYIPVDTPQAIGRFLRNWQPDLALWVESEFWPVIVTETAKHCPLVLVNGRISEKSFRFWQRHTALLTPILQSFSLLMAQSPVDAERLTMLGAVRVETPGNLKYVGAALPADTEQMEELALITAERALWVAASTHPGEELIIAEVHKQLKARFPGLLTILIPRHAWREPEVSANLKAAGVTVAIRSRKEEITSQTDIYLADTMGELGLFYRISPIVFVGGSLVKHGGQNPLEPARLNCALISGPHMFNFAEVVENLRQSGAIITVEDTSALAEALAMLLGDQDKQRQMAANALSVIQNTEAILDRVTGLLAPFIENSLHEKYAS